LKLFFLFHTLYKSLSKKGKLSKAKKIVGRISYLIKIENFSLSFIFLHQAFSYIRPLLGFKSQSKLKFNQKPLVIPLSLAQSYRLAIRWLIEGANQRSERTMALRIYNELQDAFNKKGYVFKKKYEWHNRLLSSQLKSFSFKNTFSSNSLLPRKVKGKTPPKNKKK